MQYLKYDLGQIDLICEIFRDNTILLTHYVNKKLVDQFVQLIDKEGRQQHVLNFFNVIMKRRTKYLFDNQLLVINSFLPTNIESNPSLYKYIYCELNPK